MPTREEFLEFFQSKNTPDELAYYEGINWDPRMVLVMKGQVVKAGFNRRGLRQLTGQVGALVITYKQNVPCTEEEWELVKTNYTKILQLEELHKATPEPAEIAEVYADAQKESLESTASSKDASCCGPCVIM